MKAVIVALAALLFCAAPGHAQDPAEIAFWESVKDSKNPAELQAYIDGYPTGKFVPLAKIRLNALKGGAPEPAVPGPTTQPISPTRPLVTPAAPSGPVSSNGLTVAKPAFAPFEEMQVSWAGIKAVSGSVGFGAPGETRLLQSKSVTFSTQPSGTFTFPGLINGKYEARILTGSYGSETVVARIPVEVRDPPPNAAFRPRIAPEKPNFGPMEKIAVTWADIRPPSGSVALFQEGSPRAIETLSVTFLYEKRFTGRHEFNGKAPGKYEVRVLTGEYGKETVIARAPIVVGDSPTQVAGAGAAAVGVGPVAQVGKVALSGIGEIALMESPQRVDDAALRAKILAAFPAVKCSAAELYAWAVGDQRRLDSIVGATAQAFKQRGYNVTSSMVGSGLMFAAASVVPRVEYPAINALWSLQPNGLNLLLCQPEKK